MVVASPGRCYRPPAVRDGGRVWGPAVQLYALRSPRNWGIGDFTDLDTLIDSMAGQGADVVGLNPLHALFPTDPQRASPYSPSSRQRLNVLYIDVEAVDDFAACEPARRRVESPEFQARLAALREAPLVDHAGVAAAKFEVLELLFDHFQNAPSFARRWPGRSGQGPSRLRCRAGRAAPSPCAVRSAAGPLCGGRPAMLGLARVAGGLP
nr:4-alpha-glucanotransferase [Variovorax sp. S12S4]